MPSGPLTLRELTPKPGERLVIVGTTRVGKSTLEDWMIRTFVKLHTTSELLMLDTKPRFRAELTSGGYDAARHYRKWTPGPTVPDSVRLDLTADPKAELKRAYRYGHIAIAQSDSDTDHPKMLAFVEAFYKRRDGRKPLVLVVDEGHDWFLDNGWPKHKTDILLRCARAGGEGGLGTWMVFQQPVGFPRPFASYAEQFAVFQLPYSPHVDKLYQYGFPVVAAPDTPHWWQHWRRGWPGVLPSRLEVPPHYLAQLSST